MHQPFAKSLTRAWVCCLIACAAAVFVACGSSSDSSDSSTSSESSPPAKRIATIPASTLVQKGKLTICTDVPVPPFEQFDENGTLEGFDVDLGNQIAAGFDLEPVWVNSVFDTIIAALTTGKCDVIINDMFITPEREKEIRQIPYLTSGQSFMVKKGNPDDIDPTNLDTLCGKTLTTQLGGSMVEEAKGYSKRCEDKGKPGVDLLQPQKFSDSLQQLQTGHAATLFFDSPTLGYYAKLQPNDFEIVGPIFKDDTLLGIGVEQDNKPMIDAIIKSLESVQADGSFKKWQEQWGLQQAKVPPPA
jgi:polar amino acid transport system substrate-binding protein